MTMLFYLKPHYRNLHSGVTVISYKQAKKQKKKCKPKEFILMENGEEIARSHDAEELRAIGWLRHVENRKKKAAKAFLIHLILDED